MFPTGVYVVKPVAYVVPVPFANVFQPLKVYPVLASVPTVANVVFSTVVFKTDAIDGVPVVALLPSKVISEFHCAYKVTLPIGSYVAPAA